MHERARARAQLAQHLSPSASPLPVSDHTQKLEQEHPVLCVVGGLAHLGLQLGQSLLETSVAQSLFRQHVVLLGSYLLAFAGMSQPILGLAPAPPFASCCVYSRSTFAELSSVVSVRPSSPPAPPV